MRPRPPLSDAAHEALTALLLRLTLGGQPPRPDLEAAPVVAEKPKPKTRRRQR